MKTRILDAQHTLFEGVVSEVILPAVGGEISILDDHEYLFIALGRGAIRLRALLQAEGLRFDPASRQMIARGIVKPIPVRQGVARMKNNELIILVE